MGRTARHHSPEFLEQATRLVVEFGHPVDYVASKMKISEELLAGMVQQATGKVAQPASESSQRNESRFSRREFVASSELRAMTRR